MCLQINAKEDRKKRCNLAVSKETHGFLSSPHDEFSLIYMYKIRYYNTILLKSLEGLFLM